MRGIFQKALYPCERIREFMIDYLEDKLPAVTNIRFHLHLSNCAPCREYLFLYRKAANAQTFRAENPPPDELLDATLDFLKKEGIVDEGAAEGGVTDPGIGPTYRPDRG